jgi:hypothetical protein
VVSNIRLLADYWLGRCRGLAPGLGTLALCDETLSYLLFEAVGHQMSRSLNKLVTR